VEVALPSHTQKIAFLDLEGTLLKKNFHLDNGKVAASFWTVLAEKLGPDALREEEASKDKWLKNGYLGYVDWMKDSIRFLKKHGLTKDIFDRALADVRANDGIEDLFRFFETNNIITCVITGGFKELVQPLAARFRIHHIISACECIFEGNRLSHAVYFPSDYFGKVDFMKIIMREYRLSPYEAMFVGDGKNDAALAQNVAVSIGFNAQPELKNVCTEFVDQPPEQHNLRAVAALLAKPTAKMRQPLEIKDIRLHGQPQFVDQQRCSQLWQEAMWVRKAAYAPYSKFPVGAAILAADDQIFTGTNFENAAYGSTICAERSAVAKMIAAGQRNLKAIAIVSNLKTPIPPCGACLQVLSEFARSTDILLCSADGLIECHTLDTLLPKRFNLEG
jgi:homotetrameric cytidine deaminase